MSEAAVLALTRVAGLPRSARLLEAAPEPVIMRLLDQVEYEADAGAVVAALETAAGHGASAVAGRARTLAAALLAEPDLEGTVRARLRALAEPVEA